MRREFLITDQGWLDLYRHRCLGFSGEQVASAVLEDFWSPYINPTQRAKVLGVFLWLRYREDWKTQQDRYLALGRLGYRIGQDCRELLSQADLGASPENYQPVHDAAAELKALAALRYGIEGRIGSSCLGQTFPATRLEQKLLAWLRCGYCLAQVQWPDPKRALAAFQAIEDYIEGLKDTPKGKPGTRLAIQVYVFEDQSISTHFMIGRQ